MKPIQISGLKVLLPVVIFLSALAGRDVQAASLTVCNAISEGNARYLAGDFAGAKTKYQEAIDNDNTYPLSFTDMALACARLGQFTEAETNAQRAITLDLQETKYRLNLGKIYAMQGNYT